MQLYSISETLINIALQAPAGLERTKTTESKFKSVQMIEQEHIFFNQLWYLVTTDVIKSSVLVKRVVQ